jgi:hypothetical protein
MSYKSKSEREKEDRELEVKMEQAALAVAEQEQPTTTANVDTKALQDALEGKANKDGVRTGGLGVSFATFANGTEEYRKRVLKDQYDEFKQKYGWLYDQPIKA